MYSMPWLRWQQAFSWELPWNKGGGLRELRLSGMRLEIIEGIGESVLVNDVYNANPVSMKASLKILAERGGGKTLAVLGEMYELGEYAVSGHREVGEFVASMGIKELITVGNLAQEIARGAKDNGCPETRIHVCDSWEQAAEEAERVIQRFGPGAWILVKGSRGMKMERISRRFNRDERNHGEVMERGFFDHGIALIVSLIVGPFLIPVLRILKFGQNIRKKVPGGT
jgi:hypothetical protein